MNYQEEPAERELSAEQIASNCRHVGLCKTDIFNSGICASGNNKHYLSYYPQGRMQLYWALCEERIPCTKTAADIADDCVLCGKCDEICYFITALQPLKVIRALKDFVQKKKDQMVQEIPDDRISGDLKKLVGKDWCSIDPAIRVAYSDTHAIGFQNPLPAYVALPKDVENLSSLITYCNSENLNFAVFNHIVCMSGDMVQGSLVIDISRIQDLEWNIEKGLVTAGAGISPIQIQTAAQKLGYRMTHPDALMTTQPALSELKGTNTCPYDINHPHIKACQFINQEGLICNRSAEHTSGKTHHKGYQNFSPVVYTHFSYKLRPAYAHERGFLIPAGSFDQVLHFLHGIRQKNIGQSILIMELNRMVSFFVPDKNLINQVEAYLNRELHIQYLLEVTGDLNDERAIRQMGFPLIPQEFFRSLVLSLPALQSGEVQIHLQKMIPKDHNSRILTDSGLQAIVDTMLQPLLSHPNIPKLPEKHQAFYKKFSEHADLTNLVWLADRKFLHSYLKMENHLVVCKVWIPAEKLQTIRQLKLEFNRIGSKWKIRHHIGNITLWDSEDYGLLENVFYLDHHNDHERLLMRQVINDMNHIAEQYKNNHANILWDQYIV